MFVANDVAAPLDPVQRPIRPDDAVLELMARSCLHRLPDGVGNPVAVLWMQERDVLLVGALEAAGRETVDRLEGLVRHDGIRGDFPSPRARSPRFQGEAQAFAALAERLLGREALPELPDLAPDHALGLDRQLVRLPGRPAA